MEVLSPVELFLASSSMLVMCLKLSAKLSQEFDFNYSINLVNPTS